MVNLDAGPCQLDEQETAAPSSLPSIKASPITGPKDRQIAKNRSWRTIREKSHRQERPTVGSGSNQARETRLAQVRLLMSWWKKQRNSGSSVVPCLSSTIYESATNEETVSDQIQGDSTPQEERTEDDCGGAGGEIAKNHSTFD